MSLRRAAIARPRNAPNDSPTHGATTVSTRRSPPRHNPRETTMANYRTHDEREAAFEKMERRKRRGNEKQRAVAQGFAPNEGAGVDGRPPDGKGEQGSGRAGGEKRKA